ncbi:MAG: hypothetical protein J6C06_03730 [Lachnospiraceae bacterium]|nr:hypothetical protein [Lachnospiraceae bacterium]
MKKLLVMMLVVAMSLAMLTGCNAHTNEDEASQNPEAGTVSSSEESLSDGEVSENEVSENEVSEEVVEEMTLEERIASEMPAKLEVGEDEVIVPETVTAVQIMARMEEIRVTDVEYAEDINRENLAGLLVLNCSYMEPSEFNALVNEHFGSVDELMYNFSNYLKDSNYIYGNGSLVVPEELFFDEYLTFNCDDERLEGSGLLSLQYIASGVVVNDLIVYDTEMHTSGVRTEIINDMKDLVNEHANQMSR